MMHRRPLLVYRVIGRLNVGGPAMHVVNLARGLDALTWEDVDGIRDGAAARSDPRPHGRPSAERAVAPGPREGEGHPFRTRLIAGAVPPGEGDMAYYAEERGVAVTVIPEMSREVRPTDDAVALAKLVRLFRRKRPDIVHTHTAKAGALGRMAAAMAGVPVRVHTFHGHVLGGDYFSPRVTRAYREVERQLARGTDRIVVLTESQRRELADELRIAPPERFTVVPLGLELERFRSVDPGRVRLTARSALGVRPDEKLVGVVGRLVPIKNHPLLLEAVALLVREGVPIRVLVVGGGDGEAELRARAAELGLASSVLWLGWRTDLPELYAAMDVLALPSRDEGTPVAVIEALAAGTPVVARAVGGVPDMLEGGRLGRLVESARPEEMARALRDALANDGPPPHETSVLDGMGISHETRILDGIALSHETRMVDGIVLSHETSVADEVRLSHEARQDVVSRWSVERLARVMAGVYGDEARRAGLW